MQETSIKTRERRTEVEAFVSSETSSRVSLDGGFFSTFRQCVLSTLTDVLGKPALGALVSHYRLDERAKSPSQVHEILRGLFGNGAVVLEKLIIRELYHELNVSQDETASFEFEPLVLSAKGSLSMWSRSK